MPNSSLNTRQRSSLFHYAGCLLVPLLLLAAVGFPGCKNMLFRGQSPDNLAQIADQAADGSRYVSDVCSVWGLNFSKVEGYALVTQLPGTGSDPPISGQRNALLEEMETQQVKNPEEILASNETSMAIVRAFLPPGIKKGERFDVEVRTINRSQTTDLAGGYLIMTRLKPAAVLGGNVRMGHTLGYAEGPVLTNVHFDPEGELSRVRGSLLSGGVAKESRDLGLVINPKFHSVQLAQEIERAVNRRFSVFEVSGKVGSASAKNDRNIVLQIPKTYEHNMGRFLQVVMSIAFERKPEDNLNRLEQLEPQLNDPTLARVTALRLEAIGEDAVPVLVRALSHQSEEVRFHAAQALAYLGNAEGVAELERLADRIPAFRWHSLTALTSVPDVSASSALANLLHSRSTETRCGAFRSLLARSESDPLVAGELIGNDFKLHTIPSPADPLLHISRRRNREIVIFNDTQTVADNFLYVQQGLTAKATGQGTVEIKSYFRGGKEESTVCSNQISEVIRQLGEAGCDYGTIIDLLKEAHTAGTLRTRIVIDVRPRATRLYEQGDGKAFELPDSTSPSFVAGPLPELFRDGEEDVEVDLQLPVGNEAPESETGKKPGPNRSNLNLLSKMKRNDS